MTREEIEHLKVGDKLQMTYDIDCHGQILPRAQWAEAREITHIYARREDIHGRLFVCFYTTFGENAQISGSIKEGETRYRLAN